MLSDLVRSKRGRFGLREVSPIVGISPATISRVERGVTPDIKTFLAICDWLEIPPAEFIKNTEDKQKRDDYASICTFLRTDKRINSDVANAVANLIEALYKT